MSKRVFERIGIDVSKLDIQSLESIVTNAESKLIRYLTKLLGGRDEFNVIVNAYVNDYVNVYVDIEIFSSNPINPMVEAEIDMIIDKVLEEIKNELKRRYGTK